jgi:hypothetical protein
MHILIKFPSRGRPLQLKTTFLKYIEMAQDTTKISCLVSLDDNDTSITKTQQIILKKIHPNTKICVGSPCGKIGAVNRDMEHAGVFDIILLASDDMIPLVKGYDQIIRDNMSKCYPDTDGVLFFNDGVRGNKLNTLCILGKKYYDRFGYIYHPSYKTEYCDNEFMDVANTLGKQTYFDEVIIKHDHPLWTGTAKDQTYIENDKYINEDHNNYLHRKTLGFI